METMTDTPRTNEALAALLDRDGELSEDNAPEVLVTLCKAMEREREEALADAAMWKANHDNQVSLKSMLMDRPDLGDRALRIAELIRERDEAREQVREEQRLHIQTLNERDEARQWESQALVARIQRDEFSKTLGEVREILCEALPNENQLTSFMAAKLAQERDEWKAKYIQQNKDLGCELRDPNGTIWDHAQKLQAELDAAQKHSSEH